MEIKVCGLDEYECIHQNWPDHVITIIENPAHLGITPTDTRLVLEADDIGVEAVGMVPPQRQQVLDAIEFVKTKEPEKLLIHCYQGISRSTGLALAILLVQNNKNIKKSLEDLIKIRPQAWPNDRIIEHIDSILGYDGELIEYMKNWKREESKKLIWK